MIAGGHKEDVKAEGGRSERRTASPVIEDLRPSTFNFQTFQPSTFQLIHKAPMRLSHLLLAALFLVLPLLARAGTPQYRVAAGWPVGARDAPDYGTAAVSAVTTDREGNVYVFQRAAHPVLVFDRAGRFLRTWGAGLFTNPHGCRIDLEGN